MRDEGLSLRERINDRVTKLALEKNDMERGYAHLGYMLLEAYEMQYWRLHSTTFKEYLKAPAEKLGISVNQLHMYFLTVRDLSSDFNLTELETIGITKAMKLRSAKDYALVFPDTIRKAALDPKVSAAALKKLISTTLKFPEADESNWMDCEMEFETTPEQRLLIEQTFDIAMRTEPLTKATISKPAQMLDIMIKLCQEFCGSHCGDGQ